VSEYASSVCLNSRPRYFKVTPKFVIWTNYTIEYLSIQLLMSSSYWWTCHPCNCLKWVCDFFIKLDNTKASSYLGSFWLILGLSKGESKLRWPLLGRHIVLLFRDVHVWMYPTSNFQKTFTMFVHIMLEYNLSKRLKKNNFTSFYKVRD
jgi:hypothetical protein